MKTKLKMRRGFTLVELLVVIAIIATLAGVGVPALLNKIKEGDRTQALMNAKQIGLAMFSFEGDYGSYPDDTSADTITTDGLNAGGMTLTGSSSNDYFRQLIAAGYLDSEGSFYAKAAYTKKPDSNVTGDQAIGNGENGFAYFMKTGGKGLSKSGKSSMPLLAAAVEAGKTDGSFEKEVYNKKGVILKVDNSVESFSIRTTDGKLLVGGGKTLMDTGNDSIWGDVDPEMKAPKEK